MRKDTFSLSRAGGESARASASLDASPRAQAFVHWLPP